MTATTDRTSPLRRVMAGTLLASSLFVAGCAPELPALSPEPEASGPALTLEQNDSVLESMNAAIAAADEALDPDQLARRVTGPALAVRTSQLQVASILGSTERITTLPSTYQQIILPTNETWPRTSFAITQPTDELQPPRLLALVQEGPRDPYKLWAWVQLRAGLRMPAFADAKLGSELLAPDDASLVLSPQDVVAQYADVVTIGDGSTFAGSFEPAAEDPFRTMLQQVAATQSEVLAQPDVEGTYTFSATPRPDTAIQAVRTADGGALVMAALEGTEVMEAKEGATVSPSTSTASAFLQGQTVTNRVSGTFVDMIAFYVPPAGSDQQIIVVGFSHVQTAATAG